MYRANIKFDIKISVFYKENKMNISTFQNFAHEFQNDNLVFFLPYSSSHAPMSPYLLFQSFTEQEYLTCCAFPSGLAIAREVAPNHFANTPILAGLWSTRSNRLGLALASVQSK